MKSYCTKKIIIAEIIIIVVIIAAILLPQLIGPAETASTDLNETRKSDDLIISPEQLNDNDHIVGIPIGAAAMYAGENFFDKAELIYYNSNSEGYLAVEYGKIDAFVYDKHMLEYAAAGNNSLAVLPSGSIAEENIVIGAPFGSEKLIARVNEFIAQYHSDGTYDDMHNRWIGRSDNTMPDIALPNNPTETITVGTTGLVEPMSYYGADGKLTGFDIEFINRLSAWLNVKIELTAMPFSSLIPACTSGKIDLLISNFNGSDAVKEVMLVSDTYVVSEIALMVSSSRISGVSASDSPAVTSKAKAFLKSIMDSFEKTFVRENRWKLLLNGLGVTLLLAILAAGLGTLIGALICFMRMSDNSFMTAFARIFIKLFQGTPIVVVLLVLYYVVFGNVDISAFIVCCIGFSLDFSAYTSEIFRSGIEAVPAGQIRAARALGFGGYKAFIKVVLPQAECHILPIYSGQFIAMVKMTSVAGYISVHDLTKASDIIRSRTYEAFFPLITTAVIYFLLSALLVWLLRIFEHKIDTKQRNRNIKI